jgi:hypothetical protein
MIYFNSKYLSEVLDIKPAKWKRWAREFLVADPLGGYQSGYARQFSYKDAFRVFLGGHLVSEQKFSIPDARQILFDLDVWLKKNGLYALPDPKRLRLQHPRYIYLYQSPTGKIAYAVRTIIKRETAPELNRKVEYYTLERIGSAAEPWIEDQITHARIIGINTLYRFFIERISAR